MHGTTHADLADVARLEADNVRLDEKRRLHQRRLRGLAAKN